MGGGFERPVEETVVNNYYDAPGAGGSSGAGGLSGVGGAGVMGGNEQHSHESADQGGYQLTDANYTTQGNEGNEDVGRGGYDQTFADDSAAADNSVDDVRIDDSGSGFDDGGGGSDDSGGDVL